MAIEPARLHRAADFSPERLVEHKGDTIISVALPARDEAATVGPIVAALVGALTGPGAGTALVDEVMVLDDRSTDDTAVLAADAGARVVHVDDVLPEAGPGSGKGNVLWKSVAAAAGDIVVWIDADLQSFTPAYVSGLLGPLLLDPDIALVKGFYERPEHGRVGGGRTTELMARPIISTLFPELAHIRQPLGGEYAARRDVLEQVPFAEGYGVETGLLIDIARLVGVDRIAQVDLGVRAHRHRPLNELSPQAMEVLHAALHRAGFDPAGLASTLIPAEGDPVPIQAAERPPLVTTPGYRRR